LPQSAVGGDGKDGKVSYLNKIHNATPSLHPDNFPLNVVNAVLEQPQLGMGIRIAVLFKEREKRNETTDLMASFWNIIVDATAATVAAVTPAVNATVSFAAANPTLVKAGVCVGAGVGAVVAVPVVLAAAGFTATGITAGSLGATLMSWATAASGGAMSTGTALGAAVAGLQSAAAAGLGTAATVAVAATGTAAAAATAAATGK
jgi:hypothetical protein